MEACRALGEFVPQFAKEEFKMFLAQWEAMFEKERISRPSCNYLCKHPKTNPRMRMILCHWLNESANEFEFTRQTMYRAVAFFDFLMSYESGIDSDEWQYVGAATLHFAASLEECKMLDISNFVEFALSDFDDYPQDSDILAQEARLAEQIRNRELEISAAINILRKYEIKLVKIPNSILAAGVFRYGKINLKDETFQKLTGYSSKHVQGVLEFIGNFKCFWQKDRAVDTGANFYKIGKTRMSTEDLFEKWDADEEGANES
ncbi:G1/S-specific cyclin-E2 [Phlyctochytrium planicorne]|nr:G1/S-specific cyclin-E2 [Phlyctochytrium planicorne]